MAEVLHQDKRDGYMYDPVVKQFDTTFWKQLSGTTTVSANKLRFNAASTASYLQHIFADIEFQVNVPANPTSGDSRQWGLKNPSEATRGYIYFDITNTTFSLKYCDDFGNTGSYALTWSNASYTGNAINFRIRWEIDHINVYVNNSLVTTIPQSTVQSPSGPLMAYINNGNADNMDITYMLVKRAASII